MKEVAEVHHEILPGQNSQYVNSFRTALFLPPPPPSSLSLCHDVSYVVLQLTASLEFCNEKAGSSLALALEIQMLCGSYK